MGAKQIHVYVPDYAVLPGETVQEVINSLGIAQSDLAERTGRPKKTINEIINGKAAITPETALQFERVLGVPASFWNTLEQNYRTALAKRAERERLERQLAWLSEIPVKDMERIGWIKKRNSPIEQLEEVLSYFGVASADAWKDVWNSFRSAVAFRQSTLFASDFGAMSAWLRKGEIEARKVITEPYDPAVFRSALAKARPLTQEPPAVFAASLSRLCQSAGVVVAFVPELPRLRVCGATRWLTSEKALIQLTLRYKTNDQLWFSFFHEAGHILLHGKREVFVEPTNVPKKVDSSATGYSGTPFEEEEANRFAADTLIPPSKYNFFVSSGDYSSHAIVAFAKELELAPGIVLGRLQHDLLIPYNSNLNRVLKQRLRWVFKTSKDATSS